MRPPRELAKLLVEKIVVGRDEEGRTKVDITYSFGQPGVAVGENGADGVRSSEEFLQAHGRGDAGGLLCGHPKMTSCEVAVERGPEVREAG